MRWIGWYIIRGDASPRQQQRVNGGPIGDAAAHKCTACLQAAGDSNALIESQLIDAPLAIARPGGTEGSQNRNLDNVVRRASPLPAPSPFSRRDYFLRAAANGNESMNNQLAESSRKTL